MFPALFATSHTGNTGFDLPRAVCGGLIPNSGCPLSAKFG
jgi:hypothetical protein